MSFFQLMLYQVLAGSRAAFVGRRGVEWRATVRISVVGMTGAGCGFVFDSWPFAVRLFNKVILCTKTSDRINPIFRGVLAHLGQTRQTAKRKDVPGWQAFLVAMGAS